MGNDISAPQNTWRTKVSSALDKAGWGDPQNIQYPVLANIVIEGTLVEGCYLQVRWKFSPGLSEEDQTPLPELNSHTPVKENGAVSNLSHFNRLNGLNGLGSAANARKVSRERAMSITVAALSRPTTPRDLPDGTVSSPWNSRLSLPRQADDSSCQVEWFRIPAHLSGFEAEHANFGVLVSTERSYRLTPEDIGHRLMVRALPVRLEDGTTGRMVYCGTNEAIHKKGLKGRYVSIKGACEEGELLCAILQNKLVPFCDTNGDCLWERITEDNEVEEISGSRGKWEYCATKEDIGSFLKFSFIPHERDPSESETIDCVTVYPISVGRPRIRNLVITIVHRDRSISQNESYTSSSEEEDCVNEGDILSMSGQYFGGEEGQSIYWWMRCYPNGQQQKIESKENSKLDLNSQLNASYNLCVEDVGCRIYGCCKPVRSDGVVGEVAATARTNVVCAMRPVINNLSIVVLPKKDITNTKLGVQNSLSNGHAKENQNGKPCTNKCLSLNVNYMGGKEGASIVQWFRSRETGYAGVSSSWMFQSHPQNNLQPAPKSLFSRLKFSPSGEVDDDSVDSMTEDEHSVVVSGNYPRDNDIFQTPSEQTTMLHKRRDIHKSVALQFQGDEELMRGIRTMVYYPTVDDIGHYIRAAYTPVRDDGTVGTTCTASIGPILLDKSTADAVHEFVETSRQSEIRWEVKRRGYGGLQTRIVLVTPTKLKFRKYKDEDLHAQFAHQDSVSDSSLMKSKTIKNHPEEECKVYENKRCFPIRNKRRQEVTLWKVACTSDIQTSVDPLDPTGFTLIMDEDTQLLLIAESSRERDIITLSIRAIVADRQDLDDIEDQEDV